MKIYGEHKFGRRPKGRISAESVKGKEVPRKLQPNDAGSTDDDENVCSKRGLKRAVKYYLQNTTLHGLKYLAEDRITVPERVFFGLSFVAVVITSGFFISNVYTKWSASPIIISTNAKQSLVTDVPFPAITICNLNQAQWSKVQNIDRRSSNYSLLLSLCDTVGEVTISYIGTWKYFKSILMEVAQPCEEMLIFCSFGSKTENCSWTFTSVLTDDGLCCTFNALDPKYLLRNYSEDIRLTPLVDNHFVAIDWTPEKGYPDKELPQFYYPRVSGGTGSRMGLTVILNASASEYYCSKSKSIGFKVLVHNPAELPKISNYGFLVTAGREARIPIEPVYEDAVPGIRSINKQVRRCLFSDEGDLVYYRTYSRKNCELECEAKILMTKCDCVLYYLPRIDPATRICGPNDNVCTNQVQSEIESSDTNVSCSYCLPGCFEINYQATLTSTTIVYGSFISIDEFPKEIFNDHNISEISILNFYYLSSTFRSTTKSEMFGFTEFLSNTGGLLGLFMGFSIFSLIEIFYYITVRPMCATRTLEQQRRKRDDELRWLTPIKRKSYKQHLNTHAGYFQTKSKLKDVHYKNNLSFITLKTDQIYRDGTVLYPYVD